MEAQLRSTDEPSLRADPGRVIDSSHLKVSRARGLNEPSATALMARGAGRTDGATRPKTGSRRVSRPFLPLFFACR